ncbi:caspase family protein [Rhodobacteraceae bacterium]|nr:caspase family protein [Paracoccaceae bacterium]
MKFIVHLMLAVVLLGHFALQASAQVISDKRIALVIGNSSYQNVPTLKNPGNDAADLAVALEAIGFEVVRGTDQSQGEMLDTLRIFRRKATDASIALIYFAGHGIEIDRENFLIPVDAVLEADTDVNFETVRLETLILAASGASQLSIVVVDACRDNPFSTTMQRTVASRSIGRGLSAVEPTQNTLVAYAAKEGTTASDGAGRNSPYASALISALQKPNTEIGLLMRQVRDDVLEATGGQQEPFVYGSLSAEKIYLNETRGLSLVQPEPVLEPSPDTRIVETAYWQSVAQSTVATELEGYLLRYPNGDFADLARMRIARLNSQTGTPDIALKPLVPEAVSPKTETARGLNRTELIELQERLSALGNSLGRIDGLPGPRTQAAVRKFESDVGLTPSGAPSLDVLQALRERVTDADLEDWRARRAASAQQPVRTSKPTAVPVQTPKPEEPVSTEIKPSGDSQFCQSNSQCATRECRNNSVGVPVWKKRNSCRFCRIFVNQCQ